MINTYEFISNVALKLRDKLNGDCVRNTKVFIQRNISSDLDYAETLALDIEKNKTVLSEEFGLHTDRILWIALHIRKWAEFEKTI